MYQGLMPDSIHTKISWLLVLIATLLNQKAVKISMTEYPIILLLGKKKIVNGLNYWPLLNLPSIKTTCYLIIPMMAYLARTKAINLINE